MTCRTVASELVETCFQAVGPSSGNKTLLYWAGGTTYNITEGYVTIHDEITGPAGFVEGPHTFTLAPGASEVWRYFFGYQLLEGEYCLDTWGGLYGGIVGYCFNVHP